MIVKALTKILEQLDPESEILIRVRNNETEDGVYKYVHYKLTPRNMTEIISKLNKTLIITLD